MPAQLYRLPTVPAELRTQLENKRQELIKEINGEDSALRRTLNANGIFRAADMKYNESFYRFPRNDPYNYVDGAKEYLFFTKPDLPLVMSAQAENPKGFLSPAAQTIPYFEDLAESAGYRKSVFCNLSYSATKRHDGCPFIRILSNRKTSNMDIPDIQVEELETAVNMYGTKILYPKSSQSNDEGIDFTVEFEDTRFLEIYHLFKVWDYYRSLKWYGVISPASFLKEFGPNKSQKAADGLLELAAQKAEGAMDLVRQSLMDPTQSYGEVERDYVGYIFHKVLHDHIRVFKFLIDNDGETLLYAASAIGCYPKTIQRSAFSEIPDRGPLKISVGFKVSGWFEDVMTNVVSDFNAIISSWHSLDECRANYHPIYDEEIGYVSQELVDVPFISPRIPWGEGRASEYSRYIFGWAKMKTKAAQGYSYWKANYDSTDSARELKGDTNEPLTDRQGANGKYITKNDWDYLKNQGYSDEDAQALLDQSDKYKKKEESDQTPTGTETPQSTTPQQETPAPPPTSTPTAVITPAPNSTNIGHGPGVQIVKSSIDGRTIQIPLGYQYRSVSSPEGDYEYMVNGQGEMFNLDGTRIGS